MLRINDLVKIYPGPVAALKGVSLEIPEGLFGLLGPNGAGKSTLMNILAGLLEPTGGSVTLDGADIVKDPRAVWSRLGYLPQDFGFYPSLSGAQMLDFLLRLKGVDAPQGRKALVAELLDRVNLADAAKRKVRTHSGGMRQRLGIAQAIAGNPRLVIVDEPTAGLDPQIMGVGPIYASRKALEKAGWKVGDLDLVEANDPRVVIVRRSRRLDLPRVAETTRVASAAMARGMAANQLGVDDPSEDLLAVLQAYLGFYEVMLDEWREGRLTREQLQTVMIETLPGVAAAGQRVAQSG